MTRHDVALAYIVHPRHCIALSRPQKSVCEARNKRAATWGTSRVTSYESITAYLLLYERAK